MQTQKKVLSPALIRKGLIITLSIGLITMGILLYSSTTPETWHSLRNIHLKNILLMLGAVVLSWLIEGFRVKTIASLLDEQIGFFDILRINLASIFSGNVTPLYSGTIPTQVYFFHRKGISVGKATAIVTIRLSFTSLLLAIGGPLLLFIFKGKILDEIGLSHLAGFINYILLLALFFFGFLLFLLLKPDKGEILINKFFQLKFVKKILGSRTEPFCHKVTSEAKEFHFWLNTLFQKKALSVLFVVILTFFSWLSTLAITPAVMLGLGVNIKGKIFRILLLQFIIQFFLSFIPIPGGSGVAEMGFFSIFSGYLPKHLQAISVTIWRLLSYYLNTFIGGFCFLRLFTGKENE
jgi:hypothetical protein